LVGVGVGIGQPGEAGGGAGDAEYPLAVYVGVAGGCPGVQGLGFRIRGD